MGDFDAMIEELARRRDTLERRFTALSEWRQLRGDTFASLLRARQRFTQEQRAFLDALARGGVIRRGSAVPTLNACRALRAILTEVDATILALIDE